MANTPEHRTCDPDVDLTPHGHRQACELVGGAWPFLPSEYVMVLCSPLRRARQTLAPTLSVHTHWRVTVAPEAREFMPLNFAMRPPMSSVQRKPHVDSYYAANDPLAAHPGGESFTAFVDRVQQLLRTVHSMHHTWAGPMVIVTHGGVITLARLLQTPEFSRVPLAASMQVFRQTMLERPIGNCELLAFTDQ